MAKEKTKDVKIEEEIIEKKPNKKEKFKSVYIIVTMFAVVIVVALVIALKNTGILNFESISTPKQKHKLNYTETTQIKEGIYITDVSEVVEQVMPSIVAITSKTLVNSGSFGPSWFYNNGKEQYQEGAGSGIIVSQTEDELLILTNHHVIDGAEELSVQFVNEKSYDAKIKGSSEKKDVAIISVKTRDIDDETMEQIKIATIGDSNKLKVGNGIIAIGNALGYGQSVTTGVVSALNRTVTTDVSTTKMIQIDAAINGGNSGGALINAVGEVVGINSVKYSSSGSATSASVEGMGFAIPITDVKELIEGLMNGEEIDDSDVVLGIEGYIITEAQSKAYNMPQGFYISKVTEGKGAEKAGIEMGNIVTEIEGKKVESIETIKNILLDKKSGDKIKVKVSYIAKNKYNEKEVEVTLTK